MSSHNNDAAVDGFQSSTVETGRHSTDLVVSRFRAALMAIQASELKRLYNRLPELNGASRMVVEQFADCLVATVLQSPLEALQAESFSGASHELEDALRRLFQL